MRYRSSCKTDVNRALSLLQIDECHTVPVASRCDNCNSWFPLSRSCECTRHSSPLASDLAHYRREFRPARRDSFVQSDRWCPSCQPERQHERQTRNRTWRFDYSCPLAGLSLSRHCLLDESPAKRAQSNSNYLCSMCSRHSRRNRRAERGSFWLNRAHSRCRWRCWTCSRRGGMWLLKVLLNVHYWVEYMTNILKLTIFIWRTSLSLHIIAKIRIEWVIGIADIFENLKLYVALVVGPVGSNGRQKCSCDEQHDWLHFSIICVHPLWVRRHNFLFRILSLRAAQVRNATIKVNVKIVTF